MIISFLMMAVLQASSGQQTVEVAGNADKLPRCMLNYDDALYERVKKMVKDYPQRILDWRKYDYNNPSIFIFDQKISINIREVNIKNKKKYMSFDITIDNCGTGPVDMNEELYNNVIIKNSRKEDQ
jgi:hypothetical protein